MLAVIVSKVTKQANVIWLTEYYLMVTSQRIRVIANNECERRLNVACNVVYLGYLSGFET
jgi:hypothetical protein